MLKYRVWTLIIIAVAALASYFVYSTEKTDGRFALKYGLDLTGGTHLVYEADTSSLQSSDVEDAMRALRDVIERRVNLFGVSEPIVQVENAGDSDPRLIVELPGVTDVHEAIRRLGETPLLEFKLEADLSGKTDEEIQNLPQEEWYVHTGLTGRFLKKATLSFSGQAGGITEPVVGLTFNDEGKELFSEITRKNVGRVLAIFLDGSPLSLPVIREEITGGDAVISGDFTVDEARELTRELNFGALPMPIALISTETIGPSLGVSALSAGKTAGMFGLAAVAIFMIFWYRLSGVISVVALIIYLVLMLSIFKLLPVTLTAAGIAGFILSVGMAVDANVIIFERLKEEKRGGKVGKEAIGDAFKRAWPAIRDGNLTSILSAIVLYYAGTFLTQSFALTFGLGVIVSMLTAMTITRTFLLAIVRKPNPNSDSNFRESYSR
ncbi:MAG: protein translocase subunit SecD [bacterium]|nr:protein translocase subunit SecD [bacterium]